MNYFLIVAVALWALTVVLAAVTAVKKNKKNKMLKPVNIMLAGTFVASYTMLLPVYLLQFSKNPAAERILKTILLSLHHTIRLFTINSDMGEFSDYLNSLGKDWADAYSVFATVIYVAAPVLTFGFLLSFFKKLSAYSRYLAGYFKNASVFTSLNEKSLAFASDIRRGSSELIVFANVGKCGEDLLGKAAEIGAICFKNDVGGVNFGFHSQKSEIRFFAIGSDVDENLKLSLSILGKYNNRDNTMLYVFSDSDESELLISSAEKGRIKVRRVDEIRSLIYKTLDECGNKLFSGALPEADGTKHIGAAIVGCGKIGREMLRALAWYCQMDGYSVTIDVFDKRECAYSEFCASCPELDGDRGDDRYDIRFHCGNGVDTAEFSEEISKLNGTTYVFVALGADSENISTAAHLRQLFERIHIHPFIQAAVSSTDKRTALGNIRNYRGQPYDIDFIGDNDEIYSEKVIINSELEAEALKKHLRWGKEEDFWAYEYNYRSSMASALHMRARIFCGMPGAEKNVQELSEAEKDALERLEHRRWDAYMRSEGYTYSGSPDKESRNDLAKTHNNLVPFSELSEEDKRKDSSVGSR